MKCLSNMYFLIMLCFFFVFTICKNVTYASDLKKQDYDLDQKAVGLLEMQNKLGFDPLKVNVINADIEEKEYKKLYERMRWLYSWFNEQEYALSSKESKLIRKEIEKISTGSIDKIKTFKSKRAIVETIIYKLYGHRSMGYIYFLVKHNNRWEIIHVIEVNTD